MKKRLLAALLVAGLTFPTNVYPAAISYAAGENEESYIHASDLSFNSTETSKKQINLDIKGVDEKNLAFAYDTSGIFSVNGAGEVTPLDIGHGKVKIYDITREDTVYAEITIYVWEDMLPDCPNIKISAESTDSSITITNLTENMPENIFLEYSVNQFFWYDTGVIEGLQSNSLYSIYVRARTKINNKTYTLNPDAPAVMEIKTKEKAKPDPEYVDYTMSEAVVREGNIFSINLTNVKGHDLVSATSDDETIAYPQTKTVNGELALDIIAVKKGTTNVRFTFDFSTEEQEKYVTYIYPFTVTEVPTLAFTLQTSYRNVHMVYDKTTIPEGYIAKFSFDQMNWKEADDLARSYTHPESVVYGAYYDKDGYRRSIITSQTIADYYVGPHNGDVKVDDQGDALTLNIGDEYAFEYENKEENNSYTTYAFKSDDSKIALFETAGKFIALKAGTTKITVTRTQYSFYEDGFPVAAVYNIVIPLTVKSKATPIPSPTPTNGGGHDDKTDPSANPTTAPGTPTTEPGTPTTAPDNPHGKVILTVPDVELSESIYTYNGKVRTPKLTVKAVGKTLNENDYTVKMSSGRKKVGRYSVTVSLKESTGYSGSMTCYFYIKPAKSKITSVKRKGKKTTIKWKKGNPGITGYEITYMKNNKKQKTVTVKGRNKTKKTIKIGKGYYVAVRQYKTVAGKKIYGEYSALKKVK